MSLKYFLIVSILCCCFACSSTDKACENIEQKNEQLEQCQQLQKQIETAKTKSAILRTELERRYQQDCVDLRYYRDQHQEAVCDNKAKIQHLDNKPVQ
jgi:hypothetical protein